MAEEVLVGEEEAGDAWGRGGSGVAVSRVVCSLVRLCEARMAREILSSVCRSHERGANRLCVCRNCPLPKHFQRVCIGPANLQSLASASELGAAVGVVGRLRPAVRVHVPRPELTSSLSKSSHKSQATAQMACCILTKSSQSQSGARGLIPTAQRRDQTQSPRR